ncbi:MAG: nickel-binding protein [Pseudomonadota bacterium]
MHSFLRKTLIAASLTLAVTTASAGKFVIELAQPLPTLNSANLQSQNISIEQSFAAGAGSYAVFSADSRDTLSTFLQQADINPEKISEVLFVNSPTLGGGDPAGDSPRTGHQVFVIERTIPGVGFFGLEKKTKISKGSNKAIAKLGDIIEWDHSYLTSEGTYCVYRADSPETLREHGALAGAPIGKITPVEQQTY